MKTELPVFKREVLDFSIINTHMRCPRKAMYNYVLNRGGKGENYPIGFGVAYHSYREILEAQWLDAGSPEIHPREASLWSEHAHEAALEGFVEAPSGHRYEYLNLGRLKRAVDVAFATWKREKAEGRIIVIDTEQPFDLILPSGHRYGGRFDQLLEWNGKLWIRDFKTTSRMGNTYADQFAVNHQMTGYVWAGMQLSGRPVEGVIIETCYNTKTKGPELNQFLSNRGEGHIKQWMASVTQEIEDYERNLKKVPTLGYLAFPQRTSGCSDYGGCFWRDACQMDGAWMIDKWLESHSVSSEWDFMEPDKEKRGAK